MRIEKLEDSVSFPLELGPQTSGLTLVPDEVLARAHEGKLWHLLSWRDDCNDRSGLYYKKKAIVIDLKKINGMTVWIMRPAKGAGWVGLDASLAENEKNVVLLESPRFNDEAVIWLFRNKDLIENLFGTKIEVKDLGSDY